jgi:DNA-binding response OmpR family regulator
MKILFIEPDSRIYRRLKTSLEAEFYTIDWFDGSADLIQYAATSHYDLILLALELPRTDGVTACCQLRKQGFKAPIIMLTRQYCDQDLVDILNAGADDLVEKLADPCCLVAKIRALLRRWIDCKTFYTSLSWGDLCLNPFTGTVT